MFENKLDFIIQVLSIFFTKSSRHELTNNRIDFLSKKKGNYIKCSIQPKKNLKCGSEKSISLRRSNLLYSFVSLKSSFVKNILQET